MSEHKIRSDTVKRFTQKVVEYVQQHALAQKTLLSAYGKDVIPKLPELISPCDHNFWPCLDGVVVLGVPNNPLKGIPVVHSPLKRTMIDFINNAKECKVFDQFGNTPPGQIKIKIGITVDPNEPPIVMFAGHQIEGGGVIYKPRHDRAWLFFINAKIPDPIEKALEDVKAAFSVENFREFGVKEKENPAKILAFNATAVLKDYRLLLDSATREEDLQTFLKEHPQILYPEFINSYPKHKLGSEYVTDFVLLVPSGIGPEYVFIEIEKPSKKIFTEKGHFHSDFTQAKNQLLDWELWVNQNTSYCQSNLPGLDRPVYHLVYGRDAELDESMRRKLRAEFDGTSRKFSTYDALADRFENIIKTLAEQLQ